MDWSTFSRVDLEMLTTAQILQRGIEYYANGQLIQTCYFQGVLAGRVLGSGCFYQAEMAWEATALQYHCSCPYPDFCKHLVALALAWLDDPTTFIDLGKDFEEQTQTTEQRNELLQYLVRRHPFDLLEVSKAAVIAETATAFSGAGIAATVKSIFDRQVFHPNELDEMLIRLKNIVSLLETGLQQGDEEAFRGYYGLIEALLSFCRDNLEIAEDEVFNELLGLADQVGQVYSEGQNEVLFDLLWGNYFDPLLWLINGELEKRLFTIARKFPKILARKIEAIQELPEEFLKQVGLYQLLSDCTDFVDGELLLKELQRKLEGSPTGSLWLIEKLMAGDPVEAKRVLKIKLARATPEDRAGYRERLIRLHAALGEMKQAASLSYLQFVEQPNFEEFKRLQNFLVTQPQEFSGYYRKIVQLLQDSEQWLLLVRITVASGDEEALSQFWLSQKEIFERFLASTENSEVLKELVLYLINHFTPILAESGIYELLIELMLERYEKSWQRLAVKLTGEFKKYCLRVNARERWAVLAGKIGEAMVERPDIERNFGSLIESFT